jgi:hypothetical protein
MPAPDFYRDMMVGGPFAQNITIGDRTYKGYIKEQQHSFRDYEMMEGGPGFIGRRPHEVTMTVVLLDDVEFPPGETIKNIEVSLDGELSVEANEGFQPLGDKDYLEWVRDQASEAMTAAKRMSEEYLPGRGVTA